MTCVLAYVIFLWTNISRANNKAFPLKIEINFILIVKSLCITNICCTFAGDLGNAPRL